MKLLAPANPKELSDRAQWFKKPEARELAKKGIEFGFELKGPLKSVVQKPSLYWGVHLPVNLAAFWYHHPEERSKIQSDLRRLASLKPDYAIMHGINLYWHSPSREYVNRYVNKSSAEEYLKIIQANIDFINEVKKILPIKIENGSLADFYLNKGDYELKPQTYLQSDVQKLDDLLYFRQKTGADIVLDLEHLILTLNFLNRQRNYKDLPRKIILNPTTEDKKLEEITGYWLKKGYIPYADKKITVKEVIKKLETKFYHLTGSRQDVIFGKKILAHGPINLDDTVFRKHLRLILDQKPEVIVMETACSEYDKAWNWLRPNETEISFNNLCEILLEEL